MNQPHTSPSERASISRRRFLAGAALSMAGLITLEGDVMWPGNRWYGIFVPGTNMAEFDAVAQQLQLNPSIAAYFIRLDSRFDASVLARYGDRGLTVSLTLEPWVYGMKPFGAYPDYSLAAFLTGMYDAKLRRIAQVLADYDEVVYIRLAHEANGHWYPWSVGQNGNTAQDYIDFWKHVRDIFSIAPKVRWTWACANINALRPAAPDIATFYPGDELTDRVGTTGYGWEVDAYATFTKTVNKLTTISDHDIVIPETGCELVNKVGTTQADWIASLGDYLTDTPRVRGLIWFQLGADQGGTGDYRLRDAHGFGAFNRAAAMAGCVSNGAFVPALPAVSESSMPSQTSSPAPATSAPLPPGSTRGWNPSSSPYETNVINGTYCRPKGAQVGFDKYGRMYVCKPGPTGVPRWSRAW